MENGRTYIDVVIGGKDRTFDLTELPSLSIGRSPTSTVVLSGDPLVSRKHALVQRESSGEYYLSDLGSRNGTTRNGVPVTAPVPLRDGDVFVIGSHRFAFHQPSLAARGEEEHQDPTDVLVVERMITILVLDLRDYTVLSRRLGEARISELMNRLFHDAGRVLKDRGSWAQKYIGDAVMAFWVHDEAAGTPREVVALLESLADLAALIGDVSRDFALARPLAFGAGINSGLAATGNMGSSAVADHTAMGDAVNKAFRLESASKELGREVVLGRATYELLDLPDPTRALFETREVLLKGYDEPERVHTLRLGDLPRVLGALRG
ncbi:MAG TPA: adenylate/guanylate cyclase domain-containing protein [Longimicrobiales bacterium]|nr:adenylate/guanylate cyclase domain-containing protein [Longimicrobiales bacterium]